MRYAIGGGLILAGLISRAVFCTWLPALIIIFIGALIIGDAYYEEMRE